jgi:2-(1,2-epoxy-1,2-dihydrophenyl)acetyl-CoA isomerase
VRRGPELAAATDALLTQLAQAPTRGLAAIKRALHASAGNTLEQQLDLERDAQRDLGYSDDYREGVAAFLEKRRPGSPAVSRCRRWSRTR